MIRAFPFVPGEVMRNPIANPDTRCTAQKTKQKKKEETTVQLVSGFGVKGTWFPVVAGREMADSLTHCTEGRHVCVPGPSQCECGCRQIESQ